MFHVYSENKGADQLHDYFEADLRICFRICKKQVFSWCGSNLSNYSKQIFLSQNIYNTIVIDCSTDAKIQAIEMKLKNMERSQKDFTLSLKPELPPGSSKYSATRSDQAQKHGGKPYSKGKNYRK